MKIGSTVINLIIVVLFENERKVREKADQEKHRGVG
jgi:hypothetical protein